MYRRRERFHFSLIFADTALYYTNHKSVNHASRVAVLKVARQMPPVENVIGTSDVKGFGDTLLQLEIGVRSYSPICHLLCDG